MIASQIGEIDVQRLDVFARSADLASCRPASDGQLRHCVSAGRVRDVFAWPAREPTSLRGSRYSDRGKAVSERVTRTRRASSARAALRHGGSVSSRARRGVQCSACRVLYHA
jgi:hypothetical protein